MNRRLSFLIALSIFLIGSSKGQEYLQPTSIITIKGDTLNNISLVPGKFSTNEDQVSYLDQNKVKVTLQAEELYSYHDGTDYYLSTFVNNQSVNKMVSFKLSGPLGVGQSKKSNGDHILYFKKKEDSTVVSLHPYRYELIDFLKEYLPEFDAFEQKYRVKTHYNLKTLAELASAYNAFIDPDHYVFEGFKSSLDPALGILFSYNIPTFSYKLESTSFAPSLSYSMGGFIETNYSNNVGVLYKLLYSSYRLDASNPTMDFLKLKNLNLDATVFYKIKIDNKNYLYLGGGPSVLYNMNSYIGRSFVENTEATLIPVKSFGVGYHVVAQVSIMDRWVVFANYLAHGILTESFNRMALDDTSRKAVFKTLRLGLGYKF